jgi:hypothetical protein
MKDENAFVITNQKTGVSRIDGLPYTEVEMTNIANRQTYITYVSASNENYRYWTEIINNPTKGMLISFDRVRIKSRNIINADCRPEILIMEDKAVIQRSIQQAWDQEDGATRKPKIKPDPPHIKQPPKTTFNSLFDIEDK